MMSLRYKLYYSLGRGQEHPKHLRKINRIQNDTGIRNMNKTKNEHENNNKVGMEIVKESKKCT